MTYVSPDAFVKEPATTIVSLGGRCAVAYNLRRFFDFGGAFPFDWWITPAAATAAVLRRADPEWLYDPDLLEITDGAVSVRHSETGILFHHEFPRRWREPGMPVIPEFRSAIARPKQRTAYLLSKLLALDNAGQRIAFVHDDAGDDAADIAVALDELFPQPEWTLIELELILSPPSFDWRGDAEQWNAALSKTGLSFRRQPDAKPFSETDPTAESTTQLSAR